MGKLCMDCLEQFDNEAIASQFRTSAEGMYQDCPKIVCGGKVYSISDTIIPTIIALNSKGYITYSSSGGNHMEDEGKVYIEFATSVESLPNVPIGFQTENKLVGDGVRIKVYYEPVSPDPYDQFPEILSACEELYEWALDLEYVSTFSIFYFMPQDGEFDTFEEMNTPKKEKEAVKGLDIEKLKEKAPGGTIKLGSAEEEKPATKKRGRPKKNKE